MIEIQVEMYAYSLFFMMVTAITAFGLTIHSLKHDKFNSETMSFYKAYFVMGMFGWIIVGLRDTCYKDLDLTISLISYIATSLVLLLAIDEKNRQSINKIRVVIFALLTIMITLSTQDQKELVIIFATFGLLIYAFILGQSIKIAVRLRNIGYSIMSAAFLIIVIASVIELYSVFALNDLNLAYGVAIGSSSSGFILVGIGFLTSIMITEHNQLKYLTLRDPLTGMYNRRGLDYLIQLIIPASKRNHKCLSAIAMDIDFFKKINDTYGHDGGDEVLKAFAKMISQCPRASDVGCRLGGEEFVVVLTETDLEGAIIIAERIREMTQALRVNHQGEIIKLTTSLGVAAHCSDIDIDSLLKSADKALYKAKEEGRNRVCYIDKDEKIQSNKSGETGVCPSL